jgi:hypothetical protein
VHEATIECDSAIRTCRTHGSDRLLGEPQRRTHSRGRGARSAVIAGLIRSLQHRELSGRELE